MVGGGVLAESVEHGRRHTRLGERLDRTGRMARFDDPWIADDERAAAGQLSGEPAQPVDRARADDEPGAGPDLEIARAVAVHHAAPTGLAAATCNARER